MRMMDVVGAIERELLQVLLDNVPQERRDEANSLLNGPQVSPQGKTDVVTSQDGRRPAGQPGLLIRRARAGRQARRPPPRGRAWTYSLRVRSGALG